MSDFVIPINTDSTQGRFRNPGRFVGNQSSELYDSNSIAINDDLVMNDTLVPSSALTGLSTVIPSQTVSAVPVSYTREVPGANAHFVSDRIPLASVVAFSSSMVPSSYRSQVALPISIPISNNFFHNLDQAMEYPPLPVNIELNATIDSSQDLICGIIKQKTLAKVMVFGLLGLFLWFVSIIADR